MRGHIVYEAAGRRFVMIPRDHRIQPRCSRCAFFTQRPGEFFLPCPADARGNKVCDYGHQWTFKWIPSPKTAQGSGVRVQGSGKQRGDEMKKGLLLCLCVAGALAGCGLLEDPPESSGFDRYQIRAVVDADGNEYLVEHEGGTIFHVTRIPRMEVTK